MKLRRIALIGAFVFGGSNVVNAIDAEKVEGSYRGRGDGLLEINIVRTVKDNEFAMSVRVHGSRLCTGDVVGRGVRKGNKIEFTGQEEGGSCKIGMKIGKGTITSSEEDCAEWHGMACTFNGIVKRK
jgi:hypothetical protein